jgi:hypothetical protein
MRGLLHWAIAGLLVLTMAAVSSSSAAQAPDAFRWIDFHPQDDQDVLVWVTRALDGQKWTAIREIGIEYDAALVITTFRASPQASPNHDTFSIWSVSLANRALTHIADCVNLRLTDWLLLEVGKGRELGALYDDCNDCQASTYFTTLHYDLRAHTFAGRWMTGGKAVPVWSTNAPMGVTQTQVYAVMADDNGRETLGTWKNLDYGKDKPAEDAVYRYDIEPQSDTERSVLLTGKDAASMKDRLCRAQDAVPGLSRGQDSSLCQTSVKPRYARKPVTSPPANNHGQSRPPGARQ